jgi:hypothetical protein
MSRRMAVWICVGSFLFALPSLAANFACSYEAESCCVTGTFLVASCDSFDDGVLSPWTVPLPIGATKSIHPGWSDRSPLPWPAGAHELMHRKQREVWSGSRRKSIQSTNLRWHRRGRDDPAATESFFASRFLLSAPGAADAEGRVRMGRRPAGGLSATNGAPPTRWWEFRLPPAYRRHPFRFVRAITAAVER